MVHSHFLPGCENQASVWSLLGVRSTVNFWSVIYFPCLSKVCSMLHHGSVQQVHTAEKVKFSIKDFFSKCDQTAVSCGFGHIYWRNPLMENFIFCAGSE